MLTSAFGWIGDLAKAIGSFVPRLLIVRSSHRVVKYVCGSEVVLLEPGLHVYWPLVTEIEPVAVVQQGIDLPTQLVETADGYTLAVGGVAEYEIVDAVRFLANTENGFDTIRFVCTAAILRVVRRSDLQELRSAGDGLERSLTRGAQRLLTRYGVRVRRVGLSDFARTRAVHLTGAPLAPVNVESHQ